MCIRWGWLLRTNYKFKLIFKKKNSYTFAGHNYLYSGEKTIVAYSDNEVLKYKDTYETLTQFLMRGDTPYMQTSSVMLRNIFKMIRLFMDILSLKWFICTIVTSLEYPFMYLKEKAIILTS